MPNLLDILPQDQKLRDTFICNFQADVAEKRVELVLEGVSPDTIDTSTLDGKYHKQLREYELKIIDEIAKKSGIRMEDVPKHEGDATYVECAKTRGLDPQGRNSMLR